ncbi:hypothetical protein XACW160_420014 [Xanthomonas citri pv. citri]|uniref:Uncharacterized protein n=1 Tax=Xanthomonas citri pv. citri TaxID=611301 RepID=A0A0U5BTE1_XANCI|nr:hypothetical protein XAC9322_410015 [Xanthomonas citri pv. citri]CEE26223.1 hypothetical protein XAC3824_440014 [Xanthomonas citri pv. citri]CEE27765.1 hypothetical protein XAC1083_410014 [Xanthomonas citri pv. citri]CEE39116.1 hypothetical protein XAC902_530010 [Xanthomonas citri pv. citri]CEE39613.1 hypothetical protein XAC2911_380014 [Xanthomonas citri pv. citri]
MFHSIYFWEYTKRGQVQTPIVRNPVR